MRRILAALAAASLLASAPLARANGRFPESNHIFFAEDDPSYIVLRVTFGALVSRDRGKTWGWVCEKSIGSAGVEDPMYAFTPSGTMLVSTFEGVSISHDKACSFAFAGDPIKDLVFIDLTSRPADRKDVIVFASSYDKQDDAGNILFTSQLYETTDEGQSFAPIGPAIDPDLVGETVDVAPSDPDRIYVSANANPGTTPSGVLLTSLDHAKTFEPHPIPFEGTEKSIFIAAVDPKNPDRVYLRTLNASDQPSRLIVTDDAGKNFRTVFTGQGTLPGFALSPDGSKVYIGGPLDGVQVASTTDFQFTKRSSQEIGCLALASDGLWACSSERGGFIAGLSTDDGATFQPKLHFCDIQGPLDCPAATPTNAQCTTLWPTQRASLGCGGDVSDAGGDGAADGGNDDTFVPGGGNACTCTMPSPVASFGAGGAALASCAALIARRRRRRR